MDEELAVTAVIKSARALIQRGWCQGTPRAIRGKSGRLRHALPNEIPTHYCILGAIHAVAMTLSLEDAISLSRLATERLLHFTGALEFSALVHFNDQPGRRLDEVLALLDRAAGGK